MEEAREQVKSQTPESLHLPPERVISDEKPNTVRAVAETGEDDYLAILREAYEAEVVHSTHSQQDAKEGPEELLAASKTGAMSTRMPEPRRSASLQRKKAQMLTAS